MTKIVHDVEPPAPPQTKTPIGDCPRCSQPVEGFQIDAHSREDVLVTVKPCGCTSHSTDAWHPQFIDLVKASGSLSGTNGSVVAP